MANSQQTILDKQALASACALSFVMANDRIYDTVCI